MYNNNKYNSHLLPLITPSMLRYQPDQACEIINKIAGGTSNSATVVNGAPGNLEDIEQTTTSYDDGGVNIVTAYLSDGTTSEFQIRNGRKGSQGDPGEPGEPGEPGQPGADGFSPIATVTKSGDTATISITDQGGTTTATVSDGAQGSPGPANTLSIGTVQQGVTADATITGTSPNQTLNLTLPKGDVGPAGPANSLSIGTVQQGITADATITGTTPNQVLNLSLPKGDPGNAATIAVGSTSTLTPGSSATVTNSGTSSAAVFDFGIPKGEKGDTGTAATVAVGTTSTLSPGSSATVTNSGTSSAAVFDFGIPKGDDGAAATITAGTTTTLSPGSSATVTNSGTSSAAIFDFGIPEGTPGAAATIAAGTTTTLPAGSSATVTNSGTSSAAVFDFGIPKGDTGAAGPANTLTIGTVVSGATADATITGTSPNQTLNLTLPEGPQGQPGNPGPKGDPGAGCPIGTILPFSGSTIPANYLECNGQAISRADYADLFAIIGTSYGAGDGTTTFNLPNLSGMVPVGQDTNDSDFDTLGETGGAKTINLAHSHTVNSHNHSLPANTGSHTLTTNQIPGHTHGRKTLKGTFEIRRYGTSGTGTDICINGAVGCTGIVTTAVKTWSGQHSLAGVGSSPNNPKTDVQYIDASHEHTSVGGGQGHSHTIGGNTGDKSPGTDSKLSSSQSIVQPYVTVKYIIKYADAAATVAEVLNTQSSSTSDTYSAGYINDLLFYKAGEVIQLTQTHNLQGYGYNTGTAGAIRIAIPMSKRLDNINSWSISNDAIMEIKGKSGQNTGIPVSQFSSVELWVNKVQNCLMIYGTLSGTINTGTNSPIIFSFDNGQGSITLNA